MSPNTYRLFPACKAPSCLETSLTLTTTLQGKAHNTCRTREETEAQRGEAAPSQPCRKQWVRMISEAQLLDTGDRVAAFPTSPPRPRHLRHTACEVDATEVLRAGDGVPKCGPVSWHKLDDVGGQAGRPEGAVDSIAGQHGSVTGLPQDHVALPGRYIDDSPG